MAYLHFEDVHDLAMEAELDYLSTDDWDEAQECRKRRYLYNCIAIIMAGNVQDLPEAPHG